MKIAGEKGESGLTPRPAFHYYKSMDDLMEPELLAMLTEEERREFNEWHVPYGTCNGRCLPAKIFRSLAEARQAFQKEQQDKDALEGDVVAWRLRAQANARGDDLAEARRQGDGLYQAVQMSAKEQDNLRADLRRCMEALEPFSAIQKARQVNVPNLADIEMPIADRVPVCSYGSAHIGWVHFRNAAALLSDLQQRYPKEERNG